MTMISRSSDKGLAFLLRDTGSTLTWLQSETLVGNDRRPRETWVGSLNQTGFTSNFTVILTGG
ncbi:hypothetical protein Hanom_Chr05g00446151 [Helianthus anomalus]